MVPGRLGIADVRLVHVLAEAEQLPLREGSRPWRVHELAFLHARRIEQLTLRFFPITLCQRRQCKRRQTHSFWQQTQSIVVGGATFYIEEILITPRCELRKIQLQLRLTGSGYAWR